MITEDILMITSYFKKHYKIFVGLLLAVMLCI